MQLLLTQHRCVLEGERMTVPEGTTSVEIVPSLPFIDRKVLTCCTLLLDELFVNTLQGGIEET